MKKKIAKEKRKWRENQKISKKKIKHERSNRNKEISGEAEINESVNKIKAERKSAAMAAETAIIKANGVATASGNANIYMVIAAIKIAKKNNQSIGEGSGGRRRRRGGGDK